MYLSEQDTLNYDRDGYVLVENVFAPAEVAAMISAVEGGGRVAANTYAMADGSRKAAKLALWYELGDDIWAAASTNPRVVNNVRMLLREEISFFHGKVMLKEAHSGGAWEWHQDYGYWYLEGFLFPRMLSVFVALDAATRANGCLQVLRGSHKLERLDHGRVGTQSGADPARMPALEGHFERVHVEMKPGTALFFHCNLLHSSAPNESDHPRRSFIMCYNALANPRLGQEHKNAPAPAPCPVSADDALLQFSHEPVLSA